uniref:Uncharacterized protein n=1 Tax=Arundo donax TaxID=35708 RepID=A0A0A8Y456_ARUDO
MFIRNWYHGLLNSILKYHVSLCSVKYYVISVFSLCYIMNFQKTVPSLHCVINAI